MVVYLELIVEFYRGLATRAVLWSPFVSRETKEKNAPRFQSLEKRCETQVKELVEYR